MQGGARGLAGTCRTATDVRLPLASAASMRSPAEQALHVDRYDVLPTAQDLNMLRSISLSPQLHGHCAGCVFKLRAQRPLSGGFRHACAR